MKLLPFSSFFLLFVVLISCESSLTLQQNTIFQKTLSFSDPAYYISNSSQNSTIANNPDFCKIHQPNFDFLYYSQVFDQTDSTIFVNEHYFIGIDNFLYTFLTKGVLQVFNVSFNENSAKLFHLNEVIINDTAIIDEIKDSQYLGLFYDKNREFLLILTRKTLAFVDINHQNKANWLKFTFNHFSEISTILYAKIMGNFLYILRKNNVFQVWRLKNTATTSLEKTVDLMQEFGLQNSSEILDFEVNEEFLCFIEKTSRNFFLMNNKGNFSDLSGKIVKKLSFSSNPLRIELTKAKFFILLQGDSLTNTSFLSEYSLNSSRNFELLNTQELSDFKDLYIGEDYKIISYNNHVVFSPHSLIAPLEANKGLETIFDVKNLDFIEPFVVNSENSSVNTFKLLKDSGLQLMKINMNEGKLACDTKNAAFGDYSLNLEVFLMKCEFLDEKCDKSNYYRITEEITIKVKEIEGNLQFLPGNSNENEKTVVILAVCLAVSLVLLMFFAVYAYRSWRFHNENETKAEKDPVQTYVDRVMSKEELESIGEKIGSQKIIFQT